MKSTLQKIALLSAVLLIVSCSGGGGTKSNVGIVIPEPDNGVVGQAVKGVIKGGTVTVQDSAGVDMALTATVTTGDDGSFSATFSGAEVTAGITGPLFVTVDGTGATTTCDFDNPNSATDDCPVGDGTFATFGSDYALPDGFSLYGMIADIPADGDVADPIVTVNISPATTVAASLAIADGLTPSARAATSLGLNSPSDIVAAATSAAATTANAQVMGIIASITGISFTGQKLNELSLVDLTSPTAVAAASPQAIALSSFAAAVLGGIDSTNTTVAAVLSSVISSITINSDGNVAISGNDLADIAEQMAIVLSSPALANNTAAQQASQTATQAVASGRVTGDAAVTIAQAEQSTDTSSGLSLTKAFVGKLINVINGISATTGAGGVGVTGAGATEVFADALHAVDNLSAAEVSDAFDQLENALIATEASTAAGDTTDLSTLTTETGLTGSVTKSADGSSFTLADVTSTVTNAATGITVVVSMPAGERTKTAGTAATDTDAATPATGVFSASDVTITTSQSVTTEATDGGDPVVTTTDLETYTGALNATFTDEGAGLDLGLTTFSFTGSTTTNAAAGTFTFDIELTGLSGTAVQEDPATSADGTPNQPRVSGDYSATFGFGGLTASFSGTIGSNPLDYAVTFGDGSPTGTDTVSGSVSRATTTANGIETIVDTNVLTDGTASLTLVFTSVDGAPAQLTGPTVAEDGGTEPAGQLTQGPTTGMDADGNEVTLNNVYGTVDANGLVRYSDGSVQSLPAAIN